MKEVADSNKNISYVVADITDSDDVAKVVKIVGTDFNGQLDILVNNAGWAPVTPLKELTMADYDRAFALDVRAIGISNFDNEPEIFEDIMENAEIQPQALQIEMHPFAQRLETRTLAEENDIQVEAWYPLGHADPELLENEVLVEIAENHNKTVPQTILR